MRCDECPEPDLLDENVDALRLFNQCTTQFRFGFSGPTGLDYASVRCVAEALDVDFKQQFENIQALEREYLKIVSEQRETRENE